MDDESKQTATSAEIRHMVGDVDDAVVSSIERTGASAAEVLQAVQWLRGEEGSRMRRAMSHMGRLRPYTRSFRPRNRRRPPELRSPAAS